MGTKVDMAVAKQYGDCFHHGKRQENNIDNKDYGGSKTLQI